MRVGIRFECCSEDRMVEVPGDFSWAQLTYDLLRVSRTDADNGDVELAHMDSDGRWMYEGQRFSDVVIFAAPYTTKDGIGRTSDQIEAAFRACRAAHGANMIADPDNGGGSGIDWEHLDTVWEDAQRALSPSEIEAAQREARAANDFQPDDEDEDELA